ncbi:putative F-box domain-containing protein [Tanacetum coccineum]
MAVEVVVPQDIIEQILVRADVKALIRFKSVCKSWQSLICDDRFIKAHLNHSYNNDRNNQKMGHRRIVMSRDNMPYNAQWYYWHTNECNLLGSSNGLVCISTSHGEVIVANPLNDYKVIVGSSSDFHQMSFQVLNLKTNVWKDVGKFKYVYQPRNLKKSLNLVNSNITHLSDWGLLKNAYAYVIIFTVSNG